MSKKRNRQPDVIEEPSEGSTESCDEISTEAKCPHIAKAVNFNKIKKHIKKSGITSECSTCKKGENKEGGSSETDREGYTPSSSAWICLQCGNQGCGRKENRHALKHYEKPYSDCHFMAVNTLHWSVWCYQCEMKINADCRKKLHETVEFMKRSITTMYNSPQTKTSMIQCQNEGLDADKEQNNASSNLPKVGGLMNLGNTCFFNAVLQCLAQTPFLVKVLNDLCLPGQKFVLPGGAHKPPNSSEEVELPPIEGTLERWGSFTSVLCNTLLEMQNSNGHQSYCPSKLLTSFKKKTMQCTDGGQHDAHELLRHLLELVRNEDLRRYQSIILKKVGLNEKTNPEGVEESLKSQVKFYGNQASARLLGPELVFRGVLVSTLECLDCDHSSQSAEPFLDLSLPVMAVKPQPPVLKRKNNGFEDNFDIMGNSILHAPSKHQLKKEKKAARKNRKNRRQELDDDHDLSFNRYAAEENNESDADVEDNVEGEGFMQKVEGSSCSSEKQSTLSSPVTPPTHPAQINETVNGLTMDNYSPFVPMGSIPLAQDLQDPNTNSLQSASPTDVSMADLTQTKLSDKLENLDSPENETAVQTGLSMSTSLAVNSDLSSPEGPTASLNSISSKESPTSPVYGSANGDYPNQTDKPSIDLNLIESTNEKEIEEVAWSIRKGRRKDMKNCNETCNGINGITSEMSRIDIGNNTHDSLTRYATKQGECSIQSCLNQFTALELMSGSNKVGCEVCTARERKTKENCKMVCTPTIKQYLISQVPAVLILHLKRFQAQGEDFRKVTKHVSMPVLLNLAPICKGSKRSRVYALYGVVEHRGSIHGGHYVAYVKSRLPLALNDPRWSFLPSKDAKDLEDSSCSSSLNSEVEEAAANLLSVVEPPPGKWYYVSDSRVTEIDETTVLQSQAYLLFYERIL